MGKIVWNALSVFIRSGVGHAAGCSSSGRSFSFSISTVGAPRRPARVFHVDQFDFCRRVQIVERGFQNGQPSKNNASRVSITVSP